MKNLLKYHLFISLIGLMFFNSISLLGQEVKKNKIRINVSYVKIMNGEIYFDIKSSARIDKKNKAVTDIEFSVLNIVEDREIVLGKTISDESGQSRLSLSGLNKIQQDSTGIYHIQVVFKGNDAFKKAKKNISFKDVTIDAEVITKDSINYAQAVLSDASSREPIEGQSLTVQIGRLFNPLLIGEEFNDTDEEGKISVPLDSDIPGVDGMLNVEIVLNDSDDYGTVKIIIPAKVGIPFKNESTFDQRTMWSPRNKTPIFLLIFPNLLIFGIWGIIIYLILNLLKIAKS